MPEPLLVASITEIDLVNGRDLDLDLTGAALREVAGASAWYTAVEVEWRAIAQLGLSAELELGGGIADAGGFQGLGLRVGASYSFWHDEAHGLHLQVQVTARLLDQSYAGIGPPADIGEPALAYTAGLRGGWQRGLWTLRLALDGECCDLLPHTAPLLAGASLFAGLGTEGRVGFVGLETLGDFARPNPFLVAPTLVLAVHQLPIPLRVGIGVPIFFGPTSATTGYGALLKLMLESNR
jgi:hypothetical protein